MGGRTAPMFGSSCLLSGTHTAVTLNGLTPERLRPLQQGSWRTGHRSLRVKNDLEGLAVSTETDPANANSGGSNPVRSGTVRVTQ